MIEWEIIARHLLACLTIWGLALIAGMALCRLLPSGIARRDGPVTWPLLGVAYWAVALFTFPFQYGLWLAAALAAVLAVLSRREILRQWGSFWRTAKPAAAILLLGTLACLTPLLTQYVPMGMDASMMAYNATAIGRSAGLPASYAPYLPEIPFSSVNQGACALAGLAASLGLASVETTLACVQLTFALHILATYILVRLFLHATPSAVIATLSLWMARSTQEVIVWGGFSNILTIAVGTLGVRLVIEQWRHPRYRGAIPLAIVVAALPIIHGLAAAAWIYVGLPSACVVGLAYSRKRLRALAPFALTTLVILALVGLYMLQAIAGLTSSSNDDILRYKLEADPVFTASTLLGSVPVYVTLKTGELLVYFSLLCFPLLVLARRWKALACVLASLAFLFVLIANSYFDILPGGDMLWAHRSVYWSPPIFSCMLALAWREWSRQPLRHYPRLLAHVEKLARFPWLTKSMTGLALAVVVCIAATRNYHHYQRHALEPTMSSAEWQALVWCARHLDPTQDRVQGIYGTSASYLPAVAEVWTNAWHVNVLHDRLVAPVMASRPFTHALTIEPGSMLGNRRHLERRRQSMVRLIERWQERPLAVDFFSDLANDERGLSIVVVYTVPKATAHHAD